MSGNITKSPKRQRILTNRGGFPEGCAEIIEKDEGGQLYWRAIDTNAEACFPVDEQFVREKFAELGREYKPEGK